MIDAFTLDLLRNYLLVGAALFTLGMLGFLVAAKPDRDVPVGRDDASGNGADPGRLRPLSRQLTGQVFTIVILTVAACEASIALALIVVLYNRRSSLDVTLWQDIREEGVPATSPSQEESEAEPIEPVPGPESYPILTPAGIEPAHPVQPWLERRTVKERATCPVSSCICRMSG